MAVKTKFCGVFVALAIVLNSCASIVGGGGSNKVTVNSKTNGVAFEIFDLNGMVVQSGQTPATVVLKRGSGFFKAADYTIKYKTENGEQILPVTHSLNGWYIGNILFGGIIGFLIVDPLTGAMYKLPQNVYLNAAYETEEQFNICSIEDIRPELRRYLIKIN
jgi:hypothetical protein